MQPSSSRVRDAMKSSIIIVAAMAASAAHAARPAKTPQKNASQHVAVPEHQEAAAPPVEEPVRSAMATEQPMRSATADQPVRSATPLEQPARAAAPRQDRDSGLAFGIRGAYHVPIGTLGASAQLPGIVAGGIPLWIEAGYRFNRNVYAGAVLQWASNFSANCPIGARCSSSDLRVGVEAIYTFIPRSTFSPWAGL